VNKSYTEKIVMILPEREHAFRSCRRFHEIIRKRVPNCQSIETGCHYLGTETINVSYSDLTIVNFIRLQQKQERK